jgi:hypothetical protein
MFHQQTQARQRIRRVQAQGIHLCRLIYLSDEEFEFLKLKRLDFLKRGSDFYKEPSKGRKGYKKKKLSEALQAKIRMNAYASQEGERYLYLLSLSKNVILRR